MKRVVPIPPLLCQLRIKVQILEARAEAQTDRRRALEATVEGLKKTVAALAHEVEELEHRTR